MDDMIEELTYSLLQSGEGVRKKSVFHPPPQRNLQYVFDCNGGVKQRSNMDRRLDCDAKEGTIQPAATAIQSITVQRVQFNRQKRKYAWLEHHSKCTVKRGKYKYEQAVPRIELRQFNRWE